MTIQSPQQMLAGRYELRELIGRGGMAEVHLGYDTRLSRIVAIKLLRSDIAGDPTFQARFRREATSAAALNHPSIVAVYDSGEEELTQPDGTRRVVPFIVMEYVEGHTVRELLGEGEAVPISEAVEITTGVLDALEYSHRAGIVHRDIKPGNIMLTQAGAVKVMDFGIARAVEDSAATVTQTHAVVGTAQYLSPEQARGEVVDARSDLYSTGCLLYELLTGQPPFTGDSAVAIAYQHVREIPKPPSSIAADIPDSLDRVVLKALAKNRDDRYQDAAHMRADLLAAARGLDVAAPATDTWAATTVLAPEASAAAAPSPQEQATPSEEEEQPRRRWWVWALVLAGLIALGTLLGLYAAGVLGGGDSTPTSTPSPTAVAVPEVSGMSEAEARSALEDLGLTYVKGDDVNSDTIDAGLAVSTDPGEGTSVLLGSTVTVHFSAGSAMVEVPDVSGKSEADARTAITEAGLTVGDVTEEDSTDVAAGQVIRTDPVAGTSVERGSSVSLVLSSGTTMVDVPDVSGKSQSDARTAITEAGLTVGDVTTEDSTDVAAGQVIRTDPEANTSVEQGSTVNLVVSSGKTTVPTVTGMSQEEAQAAIEAAGLTYNSSTVEETTDDESKDNQYLVTAVSPNEGSSVDVGSAVTLTITHYRYEQSDASSSQP